MPVLFWKEIETELTWGREEMEGDLGGVEGGETVVQIYCVREEYIFKKKKIVLWKIFMPCVLIILTHSPNSSKIRTPLPNHQNLFPLLKKHIESNLSHPYCPGYWIIYWMICDSPGATLLEETESLFPSSYQMSTTTLLRVRQHAYFSPCRDLVWFGLAQILHMLTQAPWIHMCNSFAVSRQFPRNHSLSLALTTFLLLNLGRS